MPPAGSEITPLAFDALQNVEILIRAAFRALRNELENLEVRSPMPEHVGFRMICSAQIRSGERSIDHNQLTSIEAILLGPGCSSQIPFTTQCCEQNPARLDHAMQLPQPVVLHALGQVSEH